MKSERINTLLAEMASSQGFINIDQHDIDSFKAKVGEIDAEKVSGKTEEIGVILDSAIFSVIARNDNKQIKGLLFVIRIPQENELASYINDVHDVIDKLGDELECKWGVATMNNLQSDHFEIIMVAGLEN